MLGDLRSHSLEHGRFDVDHPVLCEDLPVSRIVGRVDLARMDDAEAPDGHRVTFSPVAILAGEVRAETQLVVAVRVSGDFRRRTRCVPVDSRSTPPCANTLTTCRPSLPYPRDSANNLLRNTVGMADLPLVRFVGRFSTRPNSVPPQNTQTSSATHLFSDIRRQSGVIHRAEVRLLTPTCRREPDRLAIEVGSRTSTDFVGLTLP